MKISRNATKLFLILAVIGLYTLAGLAGSNTRADNTARAAGQATGPAGSLFSLTAEEAARRSAGCVDCHKGIEDMHNGSINLGCIDCHGGNADARAQGMQKGSAGYEEAKKSAHIKPRFPERWKSSANPLRPYTLTLEESQEFIRFVNPGDLRVAQLSCGTTECHYGDVHNVGKSMMTTGAMLWGAALYNNGAFPLKNYRFGESYDANGTPQRLITVPAPTKEETEKKGVLP